jgi:hypothetical protein
MELAEQEGHGTFSAGLIRQIAPNVRVLAVRIMADDGTVYGDHVLNALQWIADSSEMVSGDVVCLPVGFRPIPAFASSVLTEEFWIRSVGATNVDGDDAPAAYYSNVGRWVTDWEVGTSVVSTFPAVNAAAVPEFDLTGTGGGRRRQTADPDDFSGGFARWSGTSFSAAIHAAKLAAGKDPRKRLEGTAHVRGR